MLTLLLILLNILSEILGEAPGFGFFGGIMIFFPLVLVSKSLFTTMLLSQFSSVNCSEIRAVSQLRELGELCKEVSTIRK